jgi:hypothetical protein
MMGGNSKQMKKRGLRRGAKLPRLVDTIHISSFDGLGGRE